VLRRHGEYDGEIAGEFGMPAAESGFPGTEL
jgi:hypothetical protein